MHARARAPQLHKAVPFRHRFSAASVSLKDWIVAYRDQARGGCETTARTAAAILVGGDGTPTATRHVAAVPSWRACPRFLRGPCRRRHHHHHHHHHHSDGAANHDGTWATIPEGGCESGGGEGGAERLTVRPAARPPAAQVEALSDVCRDNTGEGVFTDNTVRARDRATPA